MTNAQTIRAYLEEFGVPAPILSAQPTLRDPLPAIVVDDTGDASAPAVTVRVFQHEATLEPGQPKPATSAYRAAVGLLAACAAALAAYRDTERPVALVSDGRQFHPLKGRKCWPGGLRLELTQTFWIEDAPEPEGEKGRRGEGENQEPPAAHGPRPVPSPSEYAASQADEA